MAGARRRGARAQSLLPAGCGARRDAELRIRCPRPRGPRRRRSPDRARARYADAFRPDRSRASHLEPRLRSVRRPARREWRCRRCGVAADRGGANAGLSRFAARRSDRSGFVEGRTANRPLHQHSRRLPARRALPGVGEERSPRDAAYPPAKGIRASNAAPCRARAGDHRGGELARHCEDGVRGTPRARSQGMEGEGSDRDPGQSSNRRVRPRGRGNPCRGRRRPRRRAPPRRQADRDGGELPRRGERLDLEDRLRRGLCPFLARRPTDAGAAEPDFRRWQDRADRFARHPRPSDDRPPVARSHRHRHLGDRIGRPGSPPRASICRDRPPRPPRRTALPRSPAARAAKWRRERGPGDEC